MKNCGTSNCRLDDLELAATVSVVFSYMLVANSPATQVSGELLFVDCSRTSSVKFLCLSVKYAVLKLFE